jgi:hypothetical protein
MKCIDTMEIAGANLCLANEGIYICDECEGKECEGCQLIPKPKYKNKKQEQPQVQYKGADMYGSSDFANLTEMIKTKEFLFGLGAGLLLGALLFRR